MKPPNIVNQTFSIAENSPNGSSVGIVVASDPDNSQQLTFAITGGNTDNAFVINPSTGELTVSNSGALNSSVNPVFNLIVEVIDNGVGNLSSQATITINVIETNQPPQIVNQTFSIAENSPNGQQVGIVIASDPDAGQTLSYSIISGNTGNAFAINTGTGALTVNNSTALNYEVATSFGLTVRVQDNGQGNLYSQAIVTVNITNVNENPNIVSQTFSIAENSLNGQQVGIVVASDPDAGQTLSYSIISGNTGNAFSINTGTGVLTVNNSTVLNYEVTTSFGLTVRVQDNGQGNLYSQATVTVNITNVNETPNIVSQTFSIAENSLNGQQVGIVVASDPDAGQTLSYTIISGNTGNAFSINTGTGALTVNNSTALNYEVTTSFGLTVRVQDNGQGNLYSQATVNINITDVNEAPEISDQTFWVGENSPNGTLVGLVLADDPDNGQQLTYSITGGNTDNAFAIDPSTGALTVSNSSAINSSVNPVFNLTVEVTDNGTGTLSSQAMMTINVTDSNQPPQINAQTFTVAENSPNGYQVGVIEASDPDAGQTLTYMIMGGNTGLAFLINTVTGALSVNYSGSLNYEFINVFELVIRVQDNGPGNLYSQAVVTINLTDVNETPEISNQAFYVIENSPNGTLVGVVLADDPDNGQQLTYSIIGGNTDNAFSLNTTTGELIISNSSVVNFSINPVFNLTVEVTDNGVGNLSSQAAVTVTVIDINQPPQIIEQTFTLAENSVSGQQVGIIQATDPDAGQTLTYSIEGGNTEDAFTIDSGTGALSVSNSSVLNYEVTTSFGLIVRVEDNGQGNLYSQAIVTVEITDVNEHPIIENQTFYIQEGSPNGYQVGVVLASDPDAGQTLTYSIMLGNTGNAFAIESNTGLLLVNDSSALNFEVNPFFWLIIRVEDDGPGNLFSMATVMVNLMDINVGTNETGMGDPLVYNLYPNPASNYISIEIENFNQDKTAISVMGMDGSILLREECEVMEGRLLKRIDIDRLGKGLYIINIENADEMIYKKFIKL